MKVFIEFPDILSNMTLVSNLDQKTLLAILYAPDEVKAEVKERLANGEDITTAEIKRLKLANESLKTMIEKALKHGLSVRHESILNAMVTLNGHGNYILRGLAN